jgi:hypothetical protein
METETSFKKKKRPGSKIMWRVLGILFIILTTATIYITRNFNELLSDALLKSFNSNIISDVYELKFEKLRVNLLQGNIKVFEVVMQPRQKPLNDYPYINSTFRLSTHKILLRNVQILDLLKKNKLQLDRIEIIEPKVELNITDKIPIFFPFNDSTAAANQVKKTGKKPIESFLLKEFELVDASINAVNTAKKREISVSGFSISVKDMLIQQQPGKDIISYLHIAVNIGALSGKMQNEALKYVSFKDFELRIDSLKIQKSVDTLIYHYADFNTGIKLLDIITADSTFHVALQSFHLGYKDKSIKLNGFTFEPNVSHAVLQKKSPYQKTEFSVKVGDLNITGLDFDTLIYSRKLFIDEISIDKVDLSLYKDKSKPVDKNKFPQYIGQKIMAIPLPMRVKNVKTTNVNLVNVERKEDGKSARVTVERGTLEAKNITNLDKEELLTLNASAYIENKVLIKLAVAYSYKNPQFSLDVRAGRFNLLDLNQLLLAYTPAKISKGTVDQIALSGTVYRTSATGTMKFLYHDLEVDLKLTDKKWQNSVVAFAANTYLSANNPPSAGIPPKVMKYQVQRDMNKGGFNVILKSFLSGMKETMIMSKENKKEYKKEKKKWRDKTNKQETK